MTVRILLLGIVLKKDNVFKKTEIHSLILSLFKI